VNVLDFLFPKHCLGCNRTGIYFCQECLGKVKRASQICPECRKPAAFGKTHLACHSRNSLDGLVAIFAYEGIVRSAIHKLKYRLVTDLLDEFLPIILKELKDRKNEFAFFNQFILQDKPMVIPISLFWYKENFRGFNQSSIIGKRLAQAFNLPFSDKILVRTKNVPSQTKLTQKERIKNVKGIFGISPRVSRLFSPIIHNSLFNILLVDDVWTTGATIKEATRVLKESGVKKVWGLTIAR